MTYFLLKHFETGEPLEMLIVPDTVDIAKLQSDLYQLPYTSELEDVMEFIEKEYPDIRVVPWSNDDNLYVVAW